MLLLNVIDFTLRFLSSGSCHDHISETLLDYRADAEQNTLHPQRLRGLIQGLWIAGYLSVEDYCDLDSLIDRFQEQNQ